jgi:hypothetical protein
LKPPGVVRPGVALLALSGGLAVGVVWYPLLALTAAAGVCAAVAARYSPSAVDKLFLRSLLVLLSGYALVGRTFAGLGVPPVYIGEIVLVIGLLTVVANGLHFVPEHRATTYLLLAFMTWGALRTVPYLHTSGLDAVRDGVLWGYGLFALLIAPMLLRRGLVDQIPEFYSRLIPWMVVCAPAWVVISQWLGIAAIPGTAMGSPKPGDVAVHLGGAAAFLLAMKGHTVTRRAGSRLFVEYAAWPVLLLGLVAMGSLTRGGLVAAFGAIFVVVALLPFKAVGKLVVAGATALLVASLWMGWGGSLPGNQFRAISPEQIAKNLGSIGGGGGGEGLDETRTWRLMWWDTILDYTLHGSYFWTGKGYGINLTYDDGVVTDPDDPSRDPHNGNLTVLARSGVPGFVLWSLLQITFVLNMLTGFARARRAGQVTRASLFAWVLAYWLACMVNASFDVYLEGPQGGIWFWCILGYGIALFASQSAGGNEASGRRMAGRAKPKHLVPV